MYSCVRACVRSLSRTCVRVSKHIMMRPCLSVRCACACWRTCQQLELFHSVRVFAYTHTHMQTCHGMQRFCHDFSCASPHSARTYISLSLHACMRAWPTMTCQSHWRLISELKIHSHWIFICIRARQTAILVRTHLLVCVTGMSEAAREVVYVTDL